MIHGLNARSKLPLGFTWSQLELQMTLRGKKSKNEMLKPWLCSLKSYFNTKARFNAMISMDMPYSGLPPLGLPRSGLPLLAWSRLAGSYLPHSCLQRSHPKPWKYIWSHLLHSCLSCSDLFCSRLPCSVLMVANFTWVNHAGHAHMDQT